MSIPSRLVRAVAGVAAVAAVLLAVPPAGVPAAAAAPTTGTVAGSVTDGATPVMNAAVDLLLPDNRIVAQARTDADGRFRLAEVRPGTYVLRFSLPGGLVQFLPGRLSRADAKPIQVRAGREFTVDETVLPHGTLAGRITTDVGAPAPGARVRLHRTDGVQVSTVLADRDGNYGFAYPPNGRFVLAVAVAGRGAPDQWVPRRRVRAEAARIDLAPGADVRRDERLLPLGTLTGRFTRDGVPVANVTVVAHSPTSAFETVTNATAADGTFRLRPYPGAYKVEFRVPTRLNLLDQWAGGAESERASVAVRVVAEEEVVLDERALPTGRIAGRLTGADGRPPERSAVVVSDPARDRRFQATTADDGSWFLLVRPGAYAVRYSTSVQSQWAVGRTSRDAADPVTVVAGGETIVDDALLPTGVLTITAVDAGTGAALTSFCADATNGYTFRTACTEEGMAKFGEIGAGSYEVTISDGDRLDTVARDVEVVSGRRTRLPARLAPAAGFAVTLVDAGTGEPVPNGCVNALPADRAPEPAQGIGGCADDTGRLVLDRLRPDRYVLFAQAYDDVHGAQWVGPQGGVGAMADARAFVADPGAAVDVTVRLDGRGAITGVVTDADTGDPVPDAVVGVWGAAASTDATGGYTLDGLGPYRWTLYTEHGDHAGQWSGGGNDRLAATGVPVAIGRATAYDVRLGRGTTLAGTISAGGRLPEQATVWVVDALTFDTLATGRAGADGRYTAHVAGPRPVKLLVEAKFGIFWMTGWHADRPGSGAPDFAAATQVFVAADGTQELNVNASGPPVD
jgi:hypothetical protein